MSWSDIRTGMQDTVKANTTKVSVYDAMPASLQGESDAVVVLPGDPLIEADSHGGGDRVSIRVMARSNRGTPQDGQRALDELLNATGTKSIRAAVETDRTLAGTVDGAQFVRVSGYGQVEGQEGCFQADIEFLALVDNA